MSVKLSFPKLIEGLLLDYDKKDRKNSYKRQHQQLPKLFKSNTETQAVLEIPDILVRIRVWIQIQEATKHACPADPDP
jgi:hypothetical protein